MIAKLTPEIVTVTIKRITIKTRDHMRTKIPELTGGGLGKINDQIIKISSNGVGKEGQEIDKIIRNSRKRLTTRQSLTILLNIKHL